jgi:hypothetical protein
MVGIAFRVSKPREICRNRPRAQRINFRASLKNYHEERDMRPHDRRQHPRAEGSRDFLILRAARRACVSNQRWTGANSATFTRPMTVNGTMVKRQTNAQTTNMSWTRQTAPA